MRTRASGWLLVGLGLALTLGVAPREARAHCDTLSGPVVRDAETALTTGDVTPVLKWIRAEDEGEVRELFAQVAAAREQGEAARQLADRLFFETVVRVHRAGEGAPFTGLKPAGTLEPGIAEADRALEQGSADALVKEIVQDVEHGIRTRFDRVAEAQRHAGDGVAQGRAFVAAYVDYVHHVEKLATASVSEAAHAHAPASGEAEHSSHVH